MCEISILEDSILTLYIFLVDFYIQKSAMWYVYLLKCRYNTYYTGCTNNVYKRLERHMKGYVHYTKDKRPLKLRAEYYEDKKK